MRLRRGTLLLACLLPAVAGLATARAAGPIASSTCMGITGSTLTPAGGEPVQVVAATVRPASSTAPPHCAVTYRIGGRINGDLRIPLSGWDGRYAQVGGGGFCGTVPTQNGSGDPYLTAGSAVGSDDSGHASSPLDAEWAYGDPPAQEDWAYRSEHLTLLAAQTLLQQLTGGPASYSYFLGCSTGGRQALMEAQRYPGDFNGIVAGAPANRQNYLAPLSQGYRERVNHNADGSLIVDTSTANTVNTAVIAACDALDGVKDGVVQDPRTCRFDPGQLLCPASGGSNCLTQAQVDVVRRWYDDPRNSSGSSLYPGGLPVGSEGGWAVNDIAGATPAYSAGGQFADQVLRFLAYPQDPTPGTGGLASFDFDQDPPKLAPLAATYNSDNPDMSGFRDGGGKLILWHGFSDPLITPFATIDYYEQGLAQMGGLDAVQSWYRFFLLPGVYHCSGGPGPGTVDWYGAITTWVETGTAPQRLVAAGNGVTRPLLPYPLRAKYSGSGDVTQQQSWTSELGPRGRATQVVLQQPAGPRPSTPTASSISVPASAPPAAVNAASTRSLAATGLAPVAPAAGLLLLTAALVVRRRARLHL